MKPHLMFRNRDFKTDTARPWNEAALIQDLGLETVFTAMAEDDAFLLKTVRAAMLAPPLDADEIRYRQEALRDCLENEAVARALYDVAESLIENKDLKFWSAFGRSPTSHLYNAVHLLESYLPYLKKLQELAGASVDRFSSEAFRNFFHLLLAELTPEYFNDIREYLSELEFPRGVFESAGLGKGNEPVAFTLHKTPPRRSFIAALFGKKQPRASIIISDRDEAGAKALHSLRERGIALVSNAASRSADHVLNFFALLRAELAFYIGCINLHKKLTRLGEPICFPVPEPRQKHVYVCRGLYDPCLALRSGRQAIANDLHAENTSAVIITGANQGGKSTFLRSIGISRLMMQCGMFVPAENYHAGLCSAVITHYKREEDASMKSGKLDEEMARMSEIVDHLDSDALVLFNESFSATNDREGSEIAKQITSALLDKKIMFFFVTHLFEFPRDLYKKRYKNVLFLRAERKEDGTRTYKIREGIPLETSFGLDVYKEIFGNDEGKGNKPGETGDPADEKAG